MKNQYFGDNRDLLKFDLVCQIVNEGLVERFTYIPMLTEDEPQKEETHVCRHQATGGRENTELLDILDRSIVNEKRNIGQLEELFARCNIRGTIYGKDRYFLHENRKAYFSGVSKELLSGSLILLDPDKGLEERCNGDGNLLYSELKYFYDTMDEGSLLMVTQRFPYDLFHEYLEMRVEEIKEWIPGSQPISIDDLDSVIFFLTRNKSLQERLVSFLREYVRKYGEKKG